MLTKLQQQSCSSLLFVVYYSQRQINTLSDLSSLTFTALCLPHFDCNNHPYRVGQHGAQVRGQREHRQRVEGSSVQQRVPEVLCGQKHDEVHDKFGIQHEEPGHGCAHHTAAVLNKPQCAVPCCVTHVGTPDHHSGCKATRLNIRTRRQQRMVLLHVS